MSAITAKASRKMKKYAVLTREPRCFLGSFDFSWEQRKLGDIADIVGGGTPSTGNQSYWDGDIDWYAPAEIADQIYANSSQKKITGLGYENSSAKMLPPGTVLFTSRAGIGKTAILTRKGCTNQGFQSIVPHRGELDSYFIFSRTEELKRYGELVGAGSTFVEVSGKQMAVMELMMPPTMREQQTIGGFFQQLDHLITLHQRKCALLFSSFQALISMMFTTSTFSWEQRKFDEVFDCTVPNNTLSRAELSYDEGTVLNVHYGDVLIKYGSVLDVQKDDIPRIPHRCREDFNGALLQDGDVIIADTAEDETTGKACEIGNLQGSAIVSGLHTMVCRPRNRMALGYLGYYLNSNAYHYQLLPLMQGIKVLSLSRSNIQKTSVSYPIAVKEQQLIAYYFRQLDNLITLHQRKCISFTVRAGRLISTVNKKRITSSWEQRKVSDLAEKTYGGGTPTTSNEAYWNGDIPWIQSSDVVDGKLLGVEPRKWITQDGLNNSAAQLIPGNSIAIITRVGVGKLAFMPYSYATSQDFLSLSKLNAEPLFTVYACYKKLQSELNAVQGTSIKGITKDELLAKNIMVPRYAEQQQIGAFFKQLDHLITLHQRKPFLMKWRTSDANRNQTNRLVL
ncbi:restriction endonuclease subunit S [Intestinimonas butyriciproducens]|uniref:restriction endonuclease subunit S n=1 Tax=Intestinimonas butyriciproducens TaxID=1297617 RepID=UPI00242E2ABD